MQPRLPSRFWFRRRSTRYAALLTAAGLALAAYAGAVWMRAGHALHEAAQQTMAASEFAFSMAPVRMPASGFEYFTTPANYRSAVVFHGNLFVTGSSALFEMNAEGRPRKVWRVGQDLPPLPSPLWPCAAASAYRSFGSAPMARAFSSTMAIRFANCFQAPLRYEA